MIPGMMLRTRQRTHVSPLGILSSVLAVVMLIRTGFLHILQLIPATAVLFFFLSRQVRRSTPRSLPPIFLSESYGSGQSNLKKTR